MINIARNILIFSVWLQGISLLKAQSPQKQEDTLTTKTLDSIFISTYLKNAAPKYMAEVEGTNIYSGKKTNEVYLDASRMNLAQNVSRTAFAQIPGLTMWDMDGAGLQINIGSRGTDSHRSIEMNMRQNGYNINSDIFGYPEAHYTPPLQAVQQVQLVRGSAALQFGSQFGGMLNYVMKDADSVSSFSLESEQTAGSNNFFNSFNSIAGKKNKISYYAYYDYRHGDGWRDNSTFNYHAYHANVSYQFNPKTSLSFQFFQDGLCTTDCGWLNRCPVPGKCKTIQSLKKFFQTGNKYSCYNF